MIEYCRFPVFFAMALRTITFCIAMPDIVRFIIGVAGDTVFQQQRGDLFVFERFEGFGCIFSLVIGMALIARSRIKSLVKKNLAAVRREQFAGYVFNADIVLFVTAYALHGSGPAKRCVTAQALSLERLMASHQGAGRNQHLRECYSKSAENNGCSDKNKKWFQRFTSSSRRKIW